MKIQAKKPITLILIGIVTAGLIVTGVCFMLFNDGKRDSLGKSVTDIECLNLRLSGMRLSEEYEITTEGNRSLISYYIFSYANGGEERLLKKRAAIDTHSVINALNSFGFVKWNGFDGKQPPGVLDGTMFRLTATINGGKKLSANGSQNFPKHFHEFEQWLYDVLKESKEIK